MASGKLLSRVFYDDLEGWDEGREGRLEREGIYIYIYVYIYIYNYGCFMLLYGRNQHNIVK